MSNRLQVEYRGHNIVFETMSERWTVDTPHGSYSHMDIGQVKKFCDKAQKSKINGTIVIKTGGVYASGLGFKALDHYVEMAFRPQVEISYKNVADRD